MQQLHSRLLAILCFLVFACVTTAQQDNCILGGAGIVGVLPLQGFSSPPEFPSPPDPLRFEPLHMEWGPRAYAGYEAALDHDNRFRFGARAVYAPLQFLYRSQEQTTITTPDGATRNALLQHDLAVQIQTISVEPFLRYEFEPDLALAVGIPLSYAVSKNYTQTMRFADPPDLTFVDGSLQQITGSGTLPNASPFVVGIHGRVEYHVPLNRYRTLYAGVAAGVTTQLTSWQQSISVTSVQPVAEVQFRWFPWKQNPEVPRDTVYQRDTVVLLSTKVTTDSIVLARSTTLESRSGDTVHVVVEESYQWYKPKPPSILSASLTLAFEQSDGTVSSEARITTRTIRRTRIVPILPLVVFDDGAADIPLRYVQLRGSEASAFREEHALTGGIHWQYHVLNVIGRRMRTVATSRIQLVSYDDGTAVGTALARQRVHAIKHYLESVFRIQSQRIGTDVRHGQQSQQPWVILIDESKSLLKPIQATDTIVEQHFPTVQIRPDVVNEVSIKSWQLVLHRDSATLREMSGTGPVPVTIRWDMNQSITGNQEITDPIYFQLHVTDVEGAKASSKAGFVSFVGSAATDYLSEPIPQTHVLRWLGPEMLHTSDADMFGLHPRFDRVHVYPSASRTNDSFIVNVPATYFPVGADVWFRRGLHPPETHLFEHAEVYISEE